MLSVLVLPLLALLGVTPNSLPLTSDDEAIVKHRFHVSYGRMAVEGGVAVCQIRFFKHDLEEAMQAHFENDAIKVDVNPHVDSLYTAYFNQHFVLEQDGDVLEGTIASSGEEGEMWWYLMQYEAERPLEHFNVTNTLLFHLFDDQRNVLKVSHFPSEKNLSYYFVEGSDTYEVTF